ncbi:phosphinothricin acetyltransferase [Paenibacillus phyllosphaerae]|uniref:Phosphinothricin acetyltransferase n=1 Tax=Paenibacillus phyllosphaerae TaxID=274593 RepID=A0A7W5B269_9BACL|nr:arsinothricin resistance N-acetyltransferase ArsN1 family A [Paenibacillus phyllosphaerae]MBB3113070.1 phosphinothricin acetyltransferase [Paenibacillus phyllosphaerae]
MSALTVRMANAQDLQTILDIYNQGIEDRIATLEMDTKDLEYMTTWFSNHGDRYSVLVAEHNDSIIGWAALNRYSPRAAYDGVADLSIYIERAHRGKGIGQRLLRELEETAERNGFYKIVLFTFSYNGLGQGLYRKQGYREVGVFQKQGILDGEFVDVMAMEKLIN